jgi:hypothetical protein
MGVVDGDDLLLDDRSLVQVRHHIMGGRADELDAAVAGRERANNVSEGAPVSELASESVSQRLRPARELASAPLALRPAKPTERSEGER